MGFVASPALALVIVDEALQTQSSFGALRSSATQSLQLDCKKQKGGPSVEDQLLVCIIVWSRFF